jgi:Icc protein
MKIIQLTDPHLVQPGQLLNGSDPLERLDICLDDIGRHHGDADLLVITGDLTDDGLDAAYHALDERLRKLGLPYRLLLGNHDRRANFGAIFPQVPRDAAGFVQSVLDTREARLIFLDTLDDGEVGGRLCATRLAWLEQRLVEAHGRPVLLFMHHPPFEIRLPALDHCLLAAGDASALATLVRGHGDVRQIFAGHVHRPAHGLWSGIPVTMLPGTNHQMPLDLRDASVGSVDEPPAYGVILLDADSLIVHLRILAFPTVGPVYG